MKTMLLSLAALGAVAATAAPAAAQPWPGYAADYGYRGAAYADARLTVGDIDRLDWRIFDAARDHRISWDEARDLRQEVREVQPIAWRVQTGRASGWEAARLDRVVTHVERAIDRPGFGWGDRGWPDRGGDDGWRR
jgi:hypothetical protein